MPNTYTQLYIHVVFAVKGRISLISSRWQEKLYQYITGIIKNKNQKLMIINRMPDHIHLLIGVKPDCSPSDLIRDVKANSSRWINENRYVAGKFEWQTGFGAFSVSHSQVGVVMDYILKQQDHHRKKTFREEYIEFLKACQIEFVPAFIFEEVDSAPSELKSNTKQP